MPLIPFLDRYYRRENNNGVGLGRKKIAKLATLKSNWEALDWRESKVTVCIYAVLLIIIKAGGQIKSKSSQERKTVLTLGCTIQALPHLSVALPGFLLPTH